MLAEAISGMIGVGKQVSKPVQEISLQVEEGREMPATEEHVLVQLLATWIIREEECRRQNAKIALTTKGPSVTIVREKKEH